MIILDTSIVITALPSIHRSLHFSATGLTWVQNAYTLTFGGLLLLGARAGDLLGRRRLFSFGIALFTAASIVGGSRPDGRRAPRRPRASRGSAPRSPLRPRLRFSRRASPKGASAPARSASTAPSRAAAAASASSSAACSPNGPRGAGASSSTSRSVPRCSGSARASCPRRLAARGHFDLAGARHLDRSA